MQHGAAASLSQRRHLQAGRRRALMVFMARLGACRSSVRARKRRLQIATGTDKGVDGDRQRGR